MDEDLLLREIVKNLTFEIEAVNQDNVVRWTTTNGTPLNVKVRVRNKDEPKLTQRGLVPVPRIGINAPDTLRLVSSEQTILSFNVYLEDQLKKQEAQKRRSGFKLFSIETIPKKPVKCESDSRTEGSVQTRNCLGTYSDDEGPYLPGSSKEKALASITSSTHSEKVTKLFGTANTLAPRNQKGLFGKCKPGGCLDPPFGEDQYSYTVPNTDRQEKHVLELRKLDNNKQALKPGGCLDPPFGEDRYPYDGLSKSDRQEKLVFERSKLDDKIQALKPGGRLHRPYSEEKCIYTHSKTDLEKTLEREHHELEDRKETDIISKGSESGRKPQENVSLHRTSARETSKDEIDSKRLMDIYARTPRENTLAYSESLITYTTDTSSTESLVDQTHSKIIPIQSNDQSPKQIYDYPESFFIPPKDVLKYKEEERRYSRELSNFKIAGSSQLKINDMLDKTKLIKTEMVDYKPVPQNVRDDINMQRIKLTLNELQSDSIDVAHKLIENKALTTHFIPSSKEPEPHIMVDSKKVNDSLNVCDEANQSHLSITSKRSFSNKEIEHLDIQQQQISKSHTEKSNNNSKNIEENVVIANIMSKQDAPIKMFATKKIESRIIDEKQHLHPDANEGEGEGVEETILSPAYTNNSFPGKKPLELSTNKETLNKKDKIPAPQPNAIEETVSSGQVDSNDSDNHEQKTLAVTYSYQTLITEQKLKSPLCPERNEKEEASVILKSPHTKIVESPDAQIKSKDVYKRISEKSKVSSTDVFVQDNSFSIIPAQNKIEKFIDSDPKISSKEGVDSTKQTAQNLAKLKISKRGPLPKDNIIEQAVDTNDDKIIRSERQEVASVTIPMMVAATNAMFEEQSLIPNDKSNVMSVTKPNEKDITPLAAEKDIPSLRPICPEVHTQEVSSQKYEWKQKEHKDSENKKNDVSSARKTGLKQEGLSNGEINAKVDTVGKQVNLDNVLIQKNLLKDNDIELSRETQEKRSSAILQKTASIPRRDSHIHKDDISKITPRKLNAFTIIGSDTSLQKQKEIEQIPENVTNVYPKIPDKTKSVPLGQTYDKTEILDRRSKNQENKIYSESTEKQLQKTIQTNVKDVHSKITDETELLDTSNKINDSSILGPQTPMPEQKGDLFTAISYNNALVSSTQISEKAETLSTAIEKSDSSSDISPKLVLLQKQKEIEQIPENVTNVYPKILDKTKSVPLSQTYEKSEILDGRSKNQEKKINSESTEEQLQKTIQTNVKDVHSKITDETELLDTSNKMHDNSIFRPQTPMPEQKGDLFTAISYNNASVPSTQISEKAETLTKAIEKSDSSSDISPELVLLQKQKEIEPIPENVTNVYPKIPDKTKSVPLGQTYDKTEILDRRSKNQENKIYSESTEKQLQKTLQTNVKDVHSKITDETELLDTSNKMHDNSIFRPQTPMPEQKGDLFTAISYNNASVPSTQISEKAETLSTAIEKSDSSSDISPKLVLLQKQKEIEPIPENVTNVYPKILDKTKSVPLSQTYEKTEILDGRSKNQENKINTESTEKQLQKTIQTNVKDVHSKITDETELLDTSNKMHDNSIFRPQTPMPEQKGDLFTAISYNNASVPSTQISEKAETLSTAIEKSDSSADISPKKLVSEKISKLYLKFTDKSVLYDRDHDKAETIPTKYTNQEKETTCEATINILQHPMMDNLRNVQSEITDVGNMVSASQSNKIEPLDNSELEQKMHHGLNLDSSPKLTLEHIKYLRSTDDNKSALISQNRDKREKIFTEQGKTAQSVTATDTSQKIIPENGDLQLNIIVDGIIAPVAPAIDETDIFIVNNGFVSSPKPILENERDLHPILIADDKSAEATQHYDKPQSLDTEKKEIESNVTRKIETNASLEIIDNFKFQPVAPRSDEPELNLIVIEENYDTRKVKDAKYEDNLSPKVTSEIADDDYISAGQTYDKTNVLDTYSNQSYRIIDKATPKLTENVLSAQKFNLSNNVIPDHYVYSSKDQEHVEFSENLATLPHFNKATKHNEDIKSPEEFIGHELANNNSELKNITEIISEKSSPFSGYSGLDNEALSNILENAEGEENKSTGSTEPDGSIGRDRNLSQVNALIVQDYASLDSKLLKVPTEHGSILTTMFDGNIDHLSPKTDDGSYKVPGNTLVNASISTLKIKTDEDTLNKIVTEVLGSMQDTSSSFDQLRRQNDDFLTELSRITNVDYVDNIIDAADLQRENQLLKIPASISNISESNKDNFGTKPSLKISLEEAFKDYGHSFISKHKEKLSSSHRVIKEAQKQTPSANKMYFETADSISIKEDKSQLYLDMSFHSYINDNNQRVVQTHIPLEQQQHNDGTVTVVKTLLHLGNEIRIPVDKENDLALYILGKNSKINNRDNIVGSPTRYTRPVKHVIDRAKKREVMNKNLALIYESGLIPLHNVIKDLTQELNTLTAKQEILQERTRNAKCTKSLRLIPVVKRCRCKRN